MPEKTLTEPSGEQTLIESLPSQPSTQPPATRSALGISGALSEGSALRGIAGAQHQLAHSSGGACGLETQRAGPVGTCSGSALTLPPQLRAQREGRVERPGGSHSVVGDSGHGRGPPSPPGPPTPRSVPTGTSCSEIRGLHRMRVFLSGMPEPRAWAPNDKVLFDNTAGVPSCPKPRSDPPEWSTRSP